MGARGGGDTEGGPRWVRALRESWDVILGVVGVVGVVTLVLVPALRDPVAWTVLAGAAGILPVNRVASLLERKG